MTPAGAVAGALHDAAVVTGTGSDGAIGSGSGCPSVLSTKWLVCSHVLTRPPPSSLSMTVASSSSSLDSAAIACRRALASSNAAFASSARACAIRRALEDFLLDLLNALVRGSVFTTFPRTVDAVDAPGCSIRGAECSDAACGAGGSAATNGATSGSTRGLDTAATCGVGI